MRTWMMLAMGLLGLVLLGGCSAVRTVGMAGVGVTNSPVPSEGKLKSVYPNGLIFEPEVSTTSTVPKPMATVAAFCRHELATRGWHETAKDEQDTFMKYEFLRESRVGAWTYARETLSLDVSQPIQDEANAPVSVFVLIHGKYVWDAPSTWVSDGLQKVFGRYSEGVMYLFLPL